MRRQLRFEQPGSDAEAAPGVLLAQFTLHSQLPQARLETPEHLLVLPLSRSHDGNHWLTAAQICAVIGLVGSRVNTAGQPLGVAVFEGPTQTASVLTDLSKLLQQNPTNPRAAARAHLDGLAAPDLARYVCILAQASVQPGGIIRANAIEEAGRQGLIGAIPGTLGPAKVTRITPAGIFTARANLSTGVTRLIKDWQQTPYPPFPVYCLAAVLERAILQRPPLLSADSETLGRIAKERDFPDPLVHQLALICDYVQTHGVITVSPTETAALAETYGASPEALTETIVQISSLRLAGISSNTVYGPFQPAQLISILRQYKLFPIATHVGGTDRLANRTPYVIEGLSRIHYLPADTPYPAPQCVLLLHHEEVRQTGPYERNAVPSATIRLYAAALP
jgi:hypothetical protein